MNKAGLAALSDQQADAIDHIRRELDLVERDINESKLSLADCVLLGTGFAGVLFGASIATSGIGAAAVGVALLIGGFLGVVGGADQLNDKLLKGENLRRRRENLAAELEALARDGELIDKEYRMRP